MDQSTLVGNQIGDGRRFVERFAADGNPVQAAFWVKKSEDGSWSLYLATDLYDREGPLATYRAIHASLEKLGETWISSSEIHAISPGDPIAKDVLAVMGRQKGRLAPRFRGRMLGPLEIDQTYIYPAHFFTMTQPDPMTSEEIGREIVRLMNRGPGTLQPSRITLKDGTHFDGIPFSLQLGSRKAVEVQFIEAGEAVPRVVQLDEIASIV